MINTINAGRYNIVIEKNSLAKFGEYLKNEIGVCRALIAADDRVYAIYAEAARNSLLGAGFTLAEDFIFPHGEKSKNLRTFEIMLRHAAEEKLTRGDVIIALGGGVTGDMAGFTAACYQRGIKYASIPTSLLAMVDSSVGGKTAVDIPEGKNLVGAFHEPSFVLSDPTLLSTLPEEYLSDGMAEVIKYGLLGNPGLFELLEKSEALDEDIAKIIAECITDKRDIVSRDFTDKGERQKLNLGHTMAHAIEILSELTVTHGHAVGSGMYLITKCAEARGLCSHIVTERVENLLKKYGLDPMIYKNFSVEHLIEAASHDKKKLGGMITIVVPREIGQCELTEMDFNGLKEFIALGY